LITLFVTLKKEHTEIEIWNFVINEHTIS